MMTSLHDTKLVPWQLTGAKLRVCACSPMFGVTACNVMTSHDFRNSVPAQNALVPWYAAATG